MDPIRWLNKFAPGFEQLSSRERNAIRDFSLLWSLFESTVLETNANAGAIIRMADQFRAQQKLTQVPFQPAIRYFCDRYYDGENFTPEFENLRLRGNDQRPLVEKVISGQSNDDSEILSAILIIVFRLRNNLFHGSKWSYGIQGQLENFRNSNNVLMAVMALHAS